MAPGIGIARDRDLRAVNARDFEYDGERAVNASPCTGFNAREGRADSNDSRAGFAARYRGDDICAGVGSLVGAACWAWPSARRCWARRAPLPRADGAAASARATKSFIRCIIGVFVESGHARL